MSAKTKCEECVSSWWLRSHHGFGGGEHTFFFFWGLLALAMICPLNFVQSRLINVVALVAVCLIGVVLTYPVARNYVIGSRLFVFTDLDGQTHMHHVGFFPNVVDRIPGYWLNVVLGGVPWIRRGDVMYDGRSKGRSVRMLTPDTIMLAMRDGHSVSMNTWYVLYFVHRFSSVDDLLVAHNCATKQLDSKEREVVTLRKLEEALNVLLRLMAFQMAWVEELRDPQNGAQKNASPYLRAMAFAIARSVQEAAENSGADEVSVAWDIMVGQAKSFRQKNGIPKCSDAKHLMVRTSHGWKCDVCRNGQFWAAVDVTKIDWGGMMADYRLATDESADDEPTDDNNN